MLSKLKQSVLNRGIMTRFDSSGGGKNYNNLGISFTAKMPFLNLISWDYKNVRLNCSRKQ
jgi:hypothetical protein